jgi:hypothetical protein
MGPNQELPQLYSRSLEDSTGFPFDLENASNFRPSCAFANSRSPSGVTRDPWNSTLKELLKESFCPFDIGLSWMSDSRTSEVTILFSDNPISG